MTHKQPQGFILPAVLSLIIAAGIFGTALLTVILNNFFVVGNNIASQQAFNIAESGVNYYLWHMSHNGADFKDGQSTPSTPNPTLGYGPYVHNYVDANGNTAGTYTLWIKPQGNGSTIASVRSIGKASNNGITRTVQAQIGAASFASYGLVADTQFWFGANESADGPIFSNIGVHMDGPNSDTVESANSSYVPESRYGGNGSTSKPGVWCNPANDSTCNTRDKSDWLYPKPSVDFNQVSDSLCTMKKVAFGDYSATQPRLADAQPCQDVPTVRTNAYIPRYATSFSSKNGYLIQLNPNGTYDLYKVTNEKDTQQSYTTALSRTAVATGIAIPPSGVIFVEDNVWVRTNPTFHGRVTIASARLASSSQTASIKIADDINYSTKDGSDAIGLVTEGDVLVQPYAPPHSGSFNFEIDAAVLAQTGAVTWPATYDGTNSCTTGWVSPNQTFTFYGSVATRLNWTWNYMVGNCGDAAYDYGNGSYYSGVEHTNTDYDYNLQYAPPPSYPVTGTYDILSWREVLTKP